MDLQTSIEEAGGWYKRYSFALAKLGIQTLEDFLYHIPSRYEDFSLISPIDRLQEGETVTIQGRIIEIQNVYTRNGVRLQKAKIQDETGIMDATWYNQPFLTRVMRKNDRISVSGKVGSFAHKLVLESPEYEIIPQEYNNEFLTIHTGRLVPIYPETRGITSKWIRRQVDKILKNQIQNIHEYIPYSIVEKYNLFPLQKAIKTIHFPTNLRDAEKARERLAFDELLQVQLAALFRKKEWEKQQRGSSFSIASYKEQIEAFWNKLPFELTNAQKKAVKEIFADLAKDKPMNRLLEGDVGSGKTVVATIAMYLAYLNGFQSVMMAPTEILAQQHYKTINNLLSPFGVNVVLVTSSHKLKTRKSIMGREREDIYLRGTRDTRDTRGTSFYDILVGTHAVLSAKINFDKLGLVIIDEQQRFGVEQRTLIRQKGTNPHLLTMTATPIPRTVALTLYGDLDLSLLDEMPTGRKKIKTWLVPTKKRLAAYEWIRSQIASFNSQLFIICPFIEESESMQTVKAAKKEYERLSKEIFPKLRLGLLHGKLKGKEKDRVLSEFKDRKIDILVATPVVEVGIDIPNATIIVIEAAERFGLAQLHQLRGRVGRSHKQSYCLLFTESTSITTMQRLKSLEKIYVGAELAELDLQLRGPGQLYGTLQHGAAKLKIANFSDRLLIEKTKSESESILPKLGEHPLLLEKIMKINVKKVAPD